MKEIICITEKDTFPAKLSKGEKYFLDESSLFVDTEGETYGNVFQFDNENELGQFPIDYFDLGCPNCLKENDNIEVYINSHKPIILKDIIKWCINIKKSKDEDSYENMISSYLMSLIVSKNLMYGEPLVSQFVINCSPLSEFISKNRTSEYFKFHGYSIYKIKN